MRNMVKTMNNFIELLKKDEEAEHEFADENLVSSLYCTSLSHPLREEPNSPDFKTENQWLFRENDDSGSIKVINFDRIPEMCRCFGVNTCDALFYDFNGNKKSYLIEFKNCSKNVLYKKYLNIKSDDCILKKIQDSKNLICTEINFEGTYNSSELVANTHIMIIYSGKNSMPAKRIPLSGVSRKKSDNNENKRKPANINFKKSVDEVTDRIGKEINKIGFSVCNEDDFPVPGIPDFVKIKGKGSIRNYTLFTDTDFRKVIEKEFFVNWDWGDYSEFFNA